MTEYPLKFTVYANATPGIINPWSCSEEKVEPINCCIPPVFNGPGGAYTPEGLFALSVLNCIVAVFKAYCEKHSVNFEKIDGNVIATMDRDTSINQILITHVEVTLNVIGASDKEKVHTILDQAIKDCPISNSIKAGKTFHIDVK